MKPFGALLPYEEAKNIVDINIKPIERVESVGIDDAIGRILAEDIVAGMDIPSFNRAAMDGYAVKAKDTFESGQFSPKVLTLVGEVHAGDKPEVGVNDGECVQVATGAVMPAGADAVVMVEDTDFENGQVKIFKSSYPYANVAKKGADIKEGITVLTDGTYMEPGKVGVLAAQGITRVNVYEKPRISILPTGK